MMCITEWLLSFFFLLFLFVCLFPFGNTFMLFHHILLADCLVSWRPRATGSYRLMIKMTVHWRLSLKHLQCEYSWGFQLLCVESLVHDLVLCFMTYQCDWESISWCAADVIDLLKWWAWIKNEGLLQFYKNCWFSYCN